MQLKTSPIFEMNKLVVPANADEANANLERLAATSRRSFLGRGLATAAVGSAGVLAASSAHAATSSTIPSLYPGSAKKYFDEIQLDEATHVNILVAAIRSLGGTPRPFPTFTGIQNLTASQFLQMAVAFENTGVGAYFGAAQYIQNQNVLAVGVSIAFVEAYHSGFLNTTANTALIPNGLTYAVPLTIAQVTAAATPYVASLNDGGLFPATFSTTPSAANDIAILNFALLLEYLEAAFYFYNVPRLFA